MSAELALQQSIITTLRANAGVAALLAEHPYGGSPQVPAVLEYAPQTATPEAATRFPYIVVGDTTAIEFDTDDINGQEHTVTLHIWDRYRGRTRVRRVMDAVYGALHHVAISVDGQHLVYCYFEFSESIPDPDVLLQHGVTRFRVVTQET